MRQTIGVAGLVLGMLLTANTALGATFTLTDFSLSTTTTNGINLSSSAASAPALPADATFTLPVAGPILLTENEGKFVRYNFTLPSGFINLAFSLQAFVDDEFAVYLNDTVIAIQADTDANNFSPPLPGFAMDSGGTVTDTSGKLDFLLGTMQSLFVVGTNELTLFGTDALISGQIGSIDGSITFETEVVGAVPEPTTLLLIGTGLSAAALRYRRRRSRV